MIQGIRKVIKLYMPIPFMTTVFPVKTTTLTDLAAKLINGFQLPRSNITKNFDMKGSYSQIFYPRLALLRN